MGEEQNLEPARTEPQPHETSAATEAQADSAAGAAGKPLTPGQRLAARKAAKAVKKKELKDELKQKEEDEQRKAEESARLSSGGAGEAALPEDVQVVARGFSDFAHEQRGKILGGLAAFFVISFGIILVRNALSSSAAEAASAFNNGLQVVNAGIDPEDSDGKTELGKPVFAARDARARKAVESFASVASRFADKPVAPWAMLGEAAQQMELGANDKALKLYEQAEAATKSHPELRARAVEGQGIVLEAQGKLDEALKRYEALGTVNGDGSKDLAEYHIARIKLAKGDREAGKKLLKELYDRLSERPEGTPASKFLKGEVEVRLAEIDSSLVDKGTTPTGGNSFSQEQLQQLLEQMRSQGGAPPGLPGEP